VDVIVCVISLSTSSVPQVRTGCHELIVTPSSWCRVREGIGDRPNLATSAIICSVGSLDRVPTTTNLEAPETPDHHHHINVMFLTLSVVRGTARHSLW